MIATPIVVSAVRFIDEKMALGTRDTMLTKMMATSVADAALRDELAHPHDERSARHEREHDEDVGEDLRHLRGEHHAVLRRLEQQQVADGIDQTQTQRQVTRDLRDLATTRLAFLAQRPMAGMTPCISCMMIDAVM